MERAHEIAAGFMESSPSSLLHTKQLLLSYDEGDVQREIEIAIKANADIRGSEDFREGVSSFLEKRAPKWTGR
jgi:enoyl-CoA hydratase/carnithine racemase